MYDTIIIGAGPAGITAGIYAKRGNLETLIIHNGESALQRTKNIENYYGFIGGISGDKLYFNGIKQAENLGIDVKNEEVIKIELNDNGYNIRIQMTICDINYDTIIDSVKELNSKYNITNFAFHCMSVSDRAKKNGLNHLNAFKWRKLVTELFKLKHQLDNIEEFSVPIIAMTENELLRLYFGNNQELLVNFKKRMQLKLCPAINGNNVYLKANNDDVFLSKCQILFDNIGNYSFKFDYNTKTFIENKENNDYNILKESKTLCPVILTELNCNKDYEEDENGNKLYYVCRVLLADEKDLDF